MTSGGEVQQIFNCRAALRLGFPMLLLFRFSLLFLSVLVLFRCCLCSFHVHNHKSFVCYGAGLHRSGACIYFE